jgi:hypothetical protein
MKKISKEFQNPAKPTDETSPHEDSSSRHNNSSAGETKPATSFPNNNDNSNRDMINIFMLRNAGTTIAIYFLSNGLHEPIAYYLKLSSAFVNEPLLLRQSIGMLANRWDDGNLIIL